MQPETHPPATRLSIMILDDEPIVCKRLKPAFQRLGYEVETFTDSDSAIKRLKETAFDVVITDLKMEGADGMLVLANAKAASPDTHVIIITGFATMETAKESYRQGAFDFIAKPFKLCDLLTCVKKIADNRKKTMASQPSSS